MAIIQWKAWKAHQDVRIGASGMFAVLREIAVFMRTIGRKNRCKSAALGELQHFFFKSPAASLII
jgi:hypothetical protein